MIYKAICTFRVFNSSVSLTQLEEAFQLKSTGGYNKGDKVSKRNPDSKLHTDSLWTLDVEKVTHAGEDSSELFDSTLIELLEVVEGLKPLLDECSYDIHAAVFSDNDQINCYLSDKTIKRLSTADVEMMFSGYAGTSEN